MMNDGAPEKVAPKTAIDNPSAKGLADPILMADRIAPPKVRKSARRQMRFGTIGFGLTLFLTVFALVTSAGLWLASGRGIQAPLWVTVEAENRLNSLIGKSHLPPGTSLSLGGIEFALDKGLTPRLVVRELQLMDASGRALISLPQVRATIAPDALLKGQILPQSLLLTGAQMAIARDAEGRFMLSFGGLSGAPGLQSAPEVIDAIDRMFSSPSFASLAVIEANGLALHLDDAMTERSWDIGDGRLLITNAAETVSSELSFTLVDDEQPAQIKLALQSVKADSGAKLWSTVENLNTNLAAHVPPLAALAMIDAQLSGTFLAELDAAGVFGRMEGQLTLQNGVLDPAAIGEVALVDGRPKVRFDAASVSLRYDPAQQRIFMDQLQVESDTLRLRASGTSDLLDALGQPAAAGSMPAQILTQLSFSNVKIDPEGLFEAPVHFGQGKADYRIFFDPFRIDIGELRLSEGDEHLKVTGHANLLAEGRWEAALDVALNQMQTDKLIRLWPVMAVPKTRDWLAKNVGQGELKDVSAALRLRPGRAPRFALEYEFSGAEVRFLRSLPPVTNGHGRSNMLDNVYTVVIDGGHVPAPSGGNVNVAGSVFQVLDITQKPAQAEVRLNIEAGLEATLSLLDQEPFRFLQKAGRRADLGQGQAHLTAELRFPLRNKLQPADVSFNVTGLVRDFSSDKLVQGKTISAPEVTVEVTPRTMRFSGKGALNGVTADVLFEQALKRESAGAGNAGGKVTGHALLSDGALRKLGVALPQGWLSGQAPASFTVDLPKGQPAILTLTSGLEGARLQIPALGWAKPASAKANFDLTATLGPRPEVTKMALNGAGLKAEARLTTAAGGGLERLSITRLKIEDWLDSPAEVIGKGKGRPVDIRLNGGRLDLRSLPGGGAGPSQGSPTPKGGSFGKIIANLDTVTVSDTIALKGFSGEFGSANGGIQGHFSAAVNGDGPIEGSVAPAASGMAVRIRSQDAGRVMAAAGIFKMAKGGTLDLTLAPNGKGKGHYSGTAELRNFSVQNAPALAELLSAVSVVGLIEQLQGQGIVFNNGSAQFEIQPGGVTISRGSATGASMGISFAGIYTSAKSMIDLQGTISPIYILNAIGQIFSSNKGEGLFGFTYRLTGSAKNPDVSVNPLSLLTPGMFRDLFRKPPPKLESNG